VIRTRYSRKPDEILSIRTETLGFEKRNEPGRGRRKSGKTASVSV